MQLKMKCNPEHAYDHAGDPAAVVQVAGTAGAQTQWVCASLDLEQSPVLGAGPHHQGRHVFKFDREAVFTCKLNVFDVESFNHFAYYKRQIQDGALLPADEATAKECGLAWPLPDGFGKAKRPDPKDAHPLTAAFKAAVEARAAQIKLAKAPPAPEAPKPAAAGKGDK